MISTQGQVDDAVGQMQKRLMDRNPNVQRQTIKLLQACTSNCDRQFRVAVCNRDFTGALKQLLNPRAQNATHPTVTKELKEMLTDWEKNFAGDPQLTLIKTTMVELRASGVDFDTGKATEAAQAAAAQAAAKEEDELNLAIAASLSLAEVT